MSWAVVDVDSGTDRVDTSTTDPSFAGGAVTGSDLGCTEAAGGAVTGSDLGCTEAAVFVPGASAVTSLLDGASRLSSSSASSVLTRPPTCPNPTSYP